MKPTKGPHSAFPTLPPRKLFGPAEPTKQAKPTKAKASKRRKVSRETSKR